MNKSGRKGDPRMHRAVAARLADPALTLFEALRAGGFDYAVDDDATAIDRESVTLGQRKNQLSRRLRLAKRGEHEYHPGGGDTGSVGPTSGGGSAGGSTCHGGGGEGRGKKRSSGNGGSSRHHNHHHRQYSHPTHNPGLLDDIDDSEFQPSAPEPAPARIKAKHHPDYRGPIIVLPRSGLRQQQTNTAAAAQQQQQQQQPPAPMEDGRRVASKSPAAYQTEQQRRWSFECPVSQPAIAVGAAIAVSCTIPIFAVRAIEPIRVAVRVATVDGAPSCRRRCCHNSTPRDESRRSTSVGGGGGVAQFHRPTDRYDTRTIGVGVESMQ